MTVKSLSLAAALVLVAGIALVAFVLLGRNDDPDQVLQAALATTCDPALTRYFDAVTSTPDVPDMHMQYDGSDYHAITTFEWGAYEEIRKGNTLYKRIGDDPWVTETRPGYTIRSLCGGASSSSDSSERAIDTQDFDLGGYNFDFRGRLTLDGESVSHYVSDPYGSPSEGGGRSNHFEEYAGSTEEYWIDDSNYIVQIRRNLVVNMPRANYSATSTTTIRLSGFGEVNTITAPGEPPPTP